jgi:hypothetical protein
LIEECDLKIGNSPLAMGGITISYPCILDARYGPVVTQRIFVQWNCDNCSGYEQNAIVVHPHPTSGFVRAVEWQTNALVNGVGMTSLVCPFPIATEERTWGQIKSLYNGQ